MLWSAAKQSMRLRRWPTASFLPASNGLIYTMDMKNGDNPTLQHRNYCVRRTCCEQWMFLFKASLQNCFVDIPPCLE
uniref:Uncharacterized protein n=1 Tax=Cucumis melo TaxID=3656 RepID=A0A9I9EI90_CUCME